MIVDDQESNSLLLEKLLRVYGFTNIKALFDSRDVVALYNDYQPDLLLLDYRMPYLDGFEVMELLNNVKGEDYLPVIMITAQDDHEHRIKGLELGAKDFIGKPFDHTEVMMRIQNMLEIRLLHNQVKRYNLELEEKVQERTKELQDLQLELLHRLVRAVEFRDHDTSDHVLRIGNYAYKLAEEVGLPKKECQLLSHACTMHDIGKIGISDKILFKPGKLDPDEWEIMKTHTTKGAQILTGSTYELINMAEIIALTHHEKWDGSGYPRGLKGKEIPLVGRITAICDLFDALISERPYKEAWTIEDAIVEIRRGSGTAFDPDIVEAFSRIVPYLFNDKEDNLE